MSFPLAVVDSVKEAVKQHSKKPFLVGYRISPEELEEPGITLSDTMKLMRKIIQKDLDYLHISVGHFKQSSIRDKQDKTPLLSLIQDEIGSEIPLIEVGMIKTPEDALEALEMGIPVLALGKELLVEPDWVEKVKNGDTQSIRTEIRPEDYDDLAFPDSMWEYVQSRPGWFRLLINECIP